MLQESIKSYLIFGNKEKKSDMKTILHLFSWMYFLHRTVVMESNVSLPMNSRVNTQHAEGIESCDGSKNNTYSCWIGDEMLSREGSFYKELKSKADSKNVIMLAFVDFSFVEMAINLHEYSLKRLNIQNYLFVCSDHDAYEVLRRRGTNVFLYPHAIDSNIPSLFGTSQFKLKVRIKHKILTAAVMLGFKTLLTDVDVVFFSNPIPQLSKRHNDLVIQDDMQIMSFETTFSGITSWNILNSGFLMVSPTYAGVDMLQRILKLLMTKRVNHQPALNWVVKDMISTNSLDITRLNIKEFPCGKEYFENEQRMFFGDQSPRGNNAIIVHNNHYYTKLGKIHRFKETGLWTVDKNQYYSKKTGRYLIYHNPQDFGDSKRATLLKEKAALITALTIGKLLNRIVIFPKFHCHGCDSNACRRATNHCSFNAHFNVQTFDEHFDGMYRENVFLKHPKVPKAIKTSISPKIRIVKKSSMGNVSTSDETIVTEDLKNIRATHLRSWLSSSSLGHFSVLNFESLYFDIKYNNPKWWNTIDQALSFCNYTQRC